MMDKLSQLWRRLLFYARRDRFDRELEEEMRFHPEMKAEENLAAALQELRKSLHLTQEQVAEMMQMNQAAISKMERQNDIYVSALRRFVSALGGELKLVASLY